MRKALITGITGQDGSYLAEFLIRKGYEVHGLIRRSSSFNRGRIDHIHDPHEEIGSNLILHYGDLADSEQISSIIYNLEPDEIYNLAAQSHVRVSFDVPEYTANISALGTTRLLEIIRRSRRPIRMYQASSSEMFGSSPPPQDEDTPFRPRSPYACAKVYSYWMVRNYREGFGLFAVNGILFNHESPRRGESFVTRKITHSLARILAGKDQFIYLGNLESRRDWGYAPEYVEFMWKMLQLEQPDDFVLGTGITCTVREFLEEAFSYVDLRPEDHVRTHPRYYRPTEVDMLQANPSKARAALGWKPRISMKEMVRIMVDADMRGAGLEPVGEGDRIIRAKFPDHWWAID